MPVLWAPPGPSARRPWAPGRQTDKRNVLQSALGFWGRRLTQLCASLPLFAESMGHQRPLGSDCAGHCGWPPWATWSQEGLAFPGSLWFLPRVPVLPADGRLPGSTTVVPVNSPSRGEGHQAPALAPGDSPLRPSTGSLQGPAGSSRPALPWSRASPVPAHFSTSESCPGGVLWAQCWTLSHRLPVSASALARPWPVASLGKHPKQNLLQDTEDHGRHLKRLTRAGCAGCALVWSPDTRAGALQEKPSLTPTKTRDAALGPELL